MDHTFDRYRELLARADAHCERVAAKHADHLHCRLGCTACCRQDLAVSRVEAEHILAWLVEHGLPEHDPAPTALDAHPLFEPLSASPHACAFLAPGGGCGIYPVRPLICRTHGTPVQLTADDGAPPRRDVCPLNLAGPELTLEQLPPEDVLDLDRLDTLLAMIDQLYCRQAEEDPVRVPLSALRAMVAA